MTEGKWQSKAQNKPRTSFSIYCKHIGSRIWICSAKIVQVSSRNPQYQHILYGSTSIISFGKNELTDMLSLNGHSNLIHDFGLGTKGKSRYARILYRNICEWCKECSYLYRINGQNPREHTQSGWLTESYCNLSPGTIKREIFSSSLIHAELQDLWGGIAFHFRSTFKSIASLPSASVSIKLTNQNESPDRF
jgi:hypothetical protein